MTYLQSVTKVKVGASKELKVARLPVGSCCIAGSAAFFDTKNFGLGSSSGSTDCCCSPS